jgi:V8-like Glu-specific endopeptidase
VNLLPLLFAQVFAPIAALGTALATISGLPAGPGAVSAQPQARAAFAPASVLTGHTPSWPAAGLQFAGTPQAGALVWQNPDGSPGTKLCSAVAVDSPAGDLIATAAHCTVGVTLGIGGSQTVAYVPDYQPGQAPFGVWYPTRITVAPQWTSHQDPNYDLAFLNVARPTSAVPLEQVTGAEHFGGAVSAGTLGVLVGYPYDSGGAVGCRAEIERESATQLRFDCADFPIGTSGGPLLTGVDPSSGIGTLAGVVGGYQLGGDRPDVSYAAALGPSLTALYRQATTPAPLPLVLNNVL